MMTLVPDVLAKGILLLEIGRWRLLPYMDGERNKFAHINHPERLRDIILSDVLEKLAHYAGTPYTSSVRVCLERRNWEDMEEWQIQRVIRGEILEGLR
jgi:hypothetical protein